MIGAGAVGLSTAIELLECGFDVHVIAEKLSPDTTSDGSGGDLCISKQIFEYQEMRLPLL